VANLFTSQTPESPDNSDGTPGITSAVTVVFAEDGVVNGVRIFTTTTVGGTYTGLFYEVTSSDPGTGTLLASEVYAGDTPDGGAWLDIVFDDPVPVTAGVAYRAGVHNSEGRYVATLAFFDEPLVNGDITAPAHNGTAGAYTVSQGVFRIDASPGYPNSPGGGETNYFADVDYTATVGITGSGDLVLPAITGSGEGTASAAGSAALTLPAITATGEGTASTAGAGALTLPALTASGAGTARATGTGTLTLPAVTASGTGGEPVDEPSAPTSTLATTSQPATLGTTSRPGYLATGTPPT
jgi:hypothetical protein